MCQAIKKQEEKKIEENYSPVLFKSGHLKTELKRKGTNRLQIKTKQKELRDKRKVIQKAGKYKVKRSGDYNKKLIWNS